jgi:hypothetical protein
MATIVGSGACGGGGEPGASETSSPTSAASASPAPPGATPPAGKTASAQATTTTASAGLALPRVARFGGLDFRFESLEARPGPVGARPAYVLAGTVRSTYTRTVVYLTPLVVDLDLAGQRLRGSPVGSGVVEPGLTVPLEYRFELASATAALPAPTDAVLTLSNLGDEPLVVPLSGAEPAAPLVANFAPPAQVVAEAVGLIFAFDAATVGHDMPIELTGIIDTTAVRAATGHGFVGLHGTATGTCPTGCPGGVLATSGLMTLVVDGSAEPPVSLSFNEVLGNGQRLEIALAYEVPLGAASYVLRVGASAGPFVEAPIEVPDLGR